MYICIYVYMYIYMYIYIYIYTYIYFFIRKVVTRGENQYISIRNARTALKGNSSNYSKRY